MMKMLINNGESSEIHIFSCKYFYGRLSLNEDNNKNIIFDIMQKGMIEESIYCNPNLTKDSYMELCRQIKELHKNIIDELTVTNYYEYEKIDTMKQ